MRPAEEETLPLSDFLRGHREEILAEWERSIREAPAARQLSSPALRDHVPALLERIGEIVRETDGPRDVSLEDLPDLHALDRLESGFDLHAATSELAVLRGVTLALWAPHAAGRDPTAVVREVRSFDETLDEILVRSVQRHARARERTLVALDRVSSAALGTGDLDRFLPRLLEVLLETTAAADAAFLMLRDDGSDVYRIRAAAGVHSEHSMGFAARAGEGFAGRVVETRQPIAVRNAAADPGVLNPALRSAGVRALYGIPLIHDDEVVGVAKLASLSAYDFSDDDKQLFRAMAQRATSLIVQAQLVGRERAALAAYRRTANELKHVMDVTPDMLALVGADGRLRTVNRAFGAVTGRSTEELLSRGYLELVHPEDRDRVREEVAAVLAGTPARRFTFRGLRKDGGVRWLSFSASAEPGTDVLVAVGRDVTEERERSELEQQLIGIVSHDLRNPLSTIHLAATALMRRTEELDERTLRSVERIHAASQRASGLIRDLLDFTKARTAGGIAITPHLMDLHAHARRVVEEILAEFPARAVHFEQRGEAGGFWDPTRIAQLIENLVTNAFKYGSAEAPVVVRTLGGDRWVRLEVHNRGTPIDPAILPHVFEPLRQGRRPDGTIGGVGLGLYIVDHIVRAHGGTIDVHSTAADGTTFIVRLPREPPLQTQGL
jgi:PAS domain S-box-containing protein